MPAAARWILVSALTRCALFAGERGGERLIKQSAFPLDRQAKGAADVGEPQAD